MPKFETRRIVNHSPDRMYDLVADIERYPEFVPLCEELTIQSKKERDGKTLLIAHMSVGYKAIRESFLSQVLLKPAERVIEVKYLEGPFKYLDNRWRFEEVDGDKCAVTFFIDYEFKSLILSTLMGSMFDRAFRMFSEAFEKRADAVYGAS
ncbi:type II toxin-antitoxin system RatA family toxin [Allorhizobium sp. BGMRC 0089]|uniref:type II toxin-antitoxin system RatA family toxin n=1 Tax=Allorhizobium sonneratiae TaxID=2934936 RepID=UPI002033F8A3|nr:type II toxin-antitoxin system RatA family toxin [Allorhizobium sonneratiae]MCM2292859.1 type II toxin-antitoxin system RatA family toxin [Allorhizobium sonneratiae]